MLCPSVRLKGGSASTGFGVLSRRHGPSLVLLPTCRGSMEPSAASLRCEKTHARDCGSHRIWCILLMVSRFLPMLLCNASPSLGIRPEASNGTMVARLQRAKKRSSAQVLTVHHSSCKYTPSHIWCFFGVSLRVSKLVLVLAK